MGLPPHTRGGPHQRRHRHLHRRPTPAYAGRTEGRRVYKYRTVGLPPHTRGGHGSPLLRVVADRPTPAYAGRTDAVRSAAVAARAYPRIRGADRDGKRPIQPNGGLPPHTRGGPNPSSGHRHRRTAYPRIRGADHDARHHRIPRNRPTPAYAGRTCLCTAWVERWTAYPRIRGADSDSQINELLNAGLPPHTRGGPAGAALIAPASPAYPRIRGADHVLHKHGLSRHGPTPAYAGRTTPRRLVRRLSTAYPRIRGADRPAMWAIGLREGLPPHTRGGLLTARSPSADWGPTPAYAGRTRPSRCGQCRRRAYPRIRGADARPHALALVHLGLPPHTRGGHFSTWAYAKLETNSDTTWFAS